MLQKRKNYHFYHSVLTQPLQKSQVIRNGNHFTITVKTRAWVIYIFDFRRPINQVPIARFSQKYGQRTQFSLSKRPHNRFIWLRACHYCRLINSKYHCSISNLMVYSSDHLQKKLRKIKKDEHPLDSFSWSTK